MNEVKPDSPNTRAIKAYDAVLWLISPADKFIYLLTRIEELQDRIDALKTLEADVIDLAIRHRHHVIGSGASLFLPELHQAVDRLVAARKPPQESPETDLDEALRRHKTVDAIREERGRVACDVCACGHATAVHTPQTWNCAVCACVGFIRGRE